MITKHSLAGVTLLFMTLVPSLQAADTTGVRAVLDPIAQRKAPPAFRLADAAGRSISLSRFRGRVVLLNFWATECGGCKVEIPWFIEFGHTYKSSGFDVVGVSMEIPYENLKDAAEAWSRVTPFVRAHQLNYPIVMGDDAVTKAFRITALPMTYLLDRHGRVAAQYLGLVDKDDIDRNIHALLNER